MRMMSLNHPRFQAQRREAKKMTNPLLGDTVAVRLGPDAQAARL